MLLDLDTYRVARALIGAHGDDAPIHGTRRADAALEAGDVRGWTDWLEIAGAADRLLTMRPAMHRQRLRNAV